MKSPSLRRGNPAAAPSRVNAANQEKALGAEVNAEGSLSDRFEYGETRWYIEHLALLVSTSKWALLGAVTGALVGGATRVFLWTLSAAGYEANRLSEHGFAPYWLLPLALVASVWLVRTFAPDAKGHGTEAMIEAIHERSGQIDA